MTGMNNDVRLVRIDGWTLEVRGELAWVRDLDLAEHAHLARPRSIRHVIKAAIDQKALQKWGGAIGNGALEVPYYRTETDVSDPNAPTVYYLNAAACLILVMRLKTERAVALQLTIARVCMRAIGGDRPAHSVAEQIDGIGQKLRELAPTVEDLRNKAENGTLATNTALGGQCRELIGTVAKREQKRWQAVHGELRVAQAVSGYRHITVLTYVRVVRDWLLSRIGVTAPALPPKAARQMPLFGDSGKGKAR